MASSHSSVSVVHYDLNARDFKFANSAPFKQIYVVISRLKISFFPFIVLSSTDLFIAWFDETSQGEVMECGKKSEM